MIKKPNKCYLCMRVTPEDVLEACKKVFESEKQAKSVAKSVSALMRRCYLKDPIVLCSRKKSVIIGSLIYIISEQGDRVTTQRKIAFALGITTQGMRNCYPKITETLGITLPPHDGRTVTVEGR